MTVPFIKLNREDSEALVEALTNPPEPNEALKAAAVKHSSMFLDSPVPRDDIQPLAPPPLHLGSYTDPYKVDWTLYEDGSVMRVASDGGTTHTNYEDIPVVVMLKIIRRADPTLRAAFCTKFNFPLI